MSGRSASQDNDLAVAVSPGTNDNVAAWQWAEDDDDSKRLNLSPENEQVEDGMEDDTEAVASGQNRHETHDDVDVSENSDMEKARTSHLDESDSKNAVGDDDMENSAKIVRERSGENQQGEVAEGRGSWSNSGSFDTADPGPETPRGFSYDSDDRALSLSQRVALMRLNEMLTGDASLDTGVLDTSTPEEFKIRIAELEERQGKSAQDGSSVQSIEDALLPLVTERSSIKAENVRDGDSEAGMHLDDVRRSGSPQMLMPKAKITAEEDFDEWSYVSDGSYQFDDAEEGSIEDEGALKKVKSQRADEKPAEESDAGTLQESDVDSIPRKSMESEMDSIPRKSMESDMDSIPRKSMESEMDSIPRKSMESDMDSIPRKSIESDIGVESVQNRDEGVDSGAGGSDGGMNWKDKTKSRQDDTEIQEDEAEIGLESPVRPSMPHARLSRENEGGSPLHISAFDRAGEGTGRKSKEIKSAKSPASAASPNESWSTVRAIFSNFYGENRSSGTNYVKSPVSRKGSVAKKLQKSLKKLGMSSKTVRAPASNVGSVAQSESRDFGETGGDSKDEGWPQLRATASEAGSENLSTGNFGGSGDFGGEASSPPVDNEAKDHEATSGPDSRFQGDGLSISEPVNDPQFKVEMQLFDEPDDLRLAEDDPARGAVEDADEEEEGDGDHMPEESNLQNSELHANETDEPPSAGSTTEEVGGAAENTEGREGAGDEGALGFLDRMQLESEISPGAESSSGDAEEKEEGDGAHMPEESNLQNSELHADKTDEPPCAGSTTEEVGGAAESTEEKEGAGDEGALGFLDRMQLESEISPGAESSSGDAEVPSRGAYDETDSAGMDKEILGIGDDSDDEENAEGAFTRDVPSVARDVGDSLEQEDMPIKDESRSDGEEQDGINSLERATTGDDGEEMMAESPDDHVNQDQIDRANGREGWEGDGIDLKGTLASTYTGVTDTDHDVNGQKDEEGALESGERSPRNTLDDKILQMDDDGAFSNDARAGGKEESDWSNGEAVDETQGVSGSDDSKTVEERKWVGWDKENSIQEMDSPFASDGNAVEENCHEIGAENGDSTVTNGGEESSVDSKAPGEVEEPLSAPSNREWALDEVQSKDSGLTDESGERDEGAVADYRKGSERSDASSDEYGVVIKDRSLPELGAAQIHSEEERPAADGEGRNLNEESTHRSLAPSGSHTTNGEPIHLNRELEGLNLTRYPDAAALPERGSHAQTLQTLGTAARDSSKSANRHDQTYEKLEALRLKFLRVVARLGQSEKNVVVAQVLHRLVLAEQLSRGRTSRQVRHSDTNEHSDTFPETLEAADQDMDLTCKILLLGRSGVGKSATVNSIFGEQKIGTDAFRSSTGKVQVIEGEVHGMKVSIIDTPGLLPSRADQRHNDKVLASVKRLIGKHAPDIVLYFERLDTRSHNSDNLPLMRTITNNFGPEIWSHAIIVLTHASSATPDGFNGLPVRYETYVSHRCQVVQQTVQQAAGDPGLINPVSLMENNKAASGQKWAKDRAPFDIEAWVRHLHLLCFASKILGDVNNLVGLQGPSCRTSQPTSPPLPLLLSSLLQSRAQTQLLHQRAGEEAESGQWRNSYQKKLWKVRNRRQGLEKKVQDLLSGNASRFEKVTPIEGSLVNSAIVPGLPEVIIPLTFDSASPGYRYRSLEIANHWHVKPIVGPQGRDHDHGHDAVAFQTVVPVRYQIPATLSGQVVQGRRDSNLQLDCSLSLDHGQGQITTTGIDLQTRGESTACTLRGETSFSNSKENRTTGGVAVTVIEDKIYGALKLEDRLFAGDRLKVVVNGGVVSGHDGSAYGGGLEVALRELDHFSHPTPSLGLSLMDWRGGLALAGTLQSQFILGGAVLIGKLNVNNKGAGEVTLRARSHDQLQIAIIGCLPVIRAFVNWALRAQSHP